MVVRDIPKYLVSETEMFIDKPDALMNSLAA